MRVSRRTLVRWSLALGVCLAGAGSLSAYYFDNKIAWSGPVTLQLQLGPGDALMDGSSDWDQSAIDALEMWNQHLKAPVQFKFVRNSTAPIKRADKVNNVFFSDDVYGEPFSTGTVAVTLLRWSGTKMVDADVVFNRAFSFNAYRGPNRGDVIDFRRVAIHEFGHVLGLNHPDVAGQAVSAIMNSYVSDTEEPQSDDVDGVESLYGKVETRSTGTRVGETNAGVVRSGFIGFPSRRDIDAFAADLEAAFRVDFQRPESVTFVDAASVARWTQEYIRYRVQDCSQDEAVQRTFMQVDGFGIQPVCGTTNRLTLPARDELFAFRSQLEAKYRDDIRANATATHVGAPADAAWLEEYLRYRLSSCSHTEASERVFGEIAGRGVAPTCDAR